MKELTCREALNRLCLDDQAEIRHALISGDTSEIKATLVRLALAVFEGAGENIGGMNDNYKSKKEGLLW